MSAPESSQPKLAGPPEWLTDWLSGARAAKRNGHPETFTPEGEPVSDGNSETDRIGRKALDDELRILGETPKGGRNDQLNRSAYKLGQLVGGGHLNGAEAWQELSAKGREIGLDAPEVYKTLRSGFYDGQRYPRQLVPRGNGNGQVNEMTEAEIRIKSPAQIAFESDPGNGAEESVPRQESSLNPADWDDGGPGDTGGAENTDANLFNSDFDTFENGPEGTPDVEVNFEAARQLFPRLDWHALWANDETPEEYIHNPLLPARRAVAIYSPPKVGKSLFVLEMAVTVSRGAEFLGYQPTRRYRVLYVDFENDPRGDVRTRLQAMNYGPDDLDYLDYLSYPSMSALDSAQGGYDLFAAVRAYGSEVVVIDTVSRAVAGEENSNDTWLNFYHHTGLRLKQLGVAMIRLDHTGKDETKGMRGGSAKSGDVDAAWRLTEITKERLALECIGNRMQLDTKLLRVTRNSDPLHHELTEGWAITRPEAMVQKLMDLANSDNLPQGASRDTIRVLAARHGIRVSNALLAEVVKRRKAVMEVTDLIPTSLLGNLSREGADSDLENEPKND